MLEFGKTTFVAIMAKLIKKVKVLIIDFDLENNNLHSVFASNQLPKDIKKKMKDEEFLSEFKLKEKNISKCTIKIDRKLKLISKTSIIFDDTYKCDEHGIEEMLKELLKSYNLILIDTSSSIQYYELTKILVRFSDKVVCLVEGSLITIKKTINLLKKYENEKSKIRLVYNKKNKYTLSSKIMKVIFLKYKVIANLEYNIKYDKIINKNVKRKTIGKDIRSDFERVIQKLGIY